MGLLGTYLTGKGWHASEWEGRVSAHGFDVTGYCATLLRVHGASTHTELAKEVAAWRANSSLFQLVMDFGRDPAQRAQLRAAGVALARAQSGACADHAKPEGSRNRGRALAANADSVLRAAKYLRAFACIDAWRTCYKTLHMEIYGVVRQRGWLMMGCLGLRAALLPQSQPCSCCSPACVLGHTHVGANSAQVSLHAHLL